MSNAQDLKKVNDLQDSLLNAMNIIATSMVDGIIADRTIECVITDTKDAKSGIYKVSNGSVEFTAYSDITNYTVDSTVYVQIPNNDWNLQKTITGRKLTSDNDKYLYKQPFDTIIDLTGNIITNDTPGGLIANYRPAGDESVAEVIYYYDKNNVGQSDNHISNINTANFQHLFNIDVSAKNYRGFTRIGLQADFKSWLRQYNACAGRYGVRISVTTKEYSILDDGAEKTVSNTYYMFLDSSDMMGNPYGFDSFFAQQKVFDLSSAITEVANTQIMSITGDFYEVSGTFLDADKKLIPYKDELSQPIFPNLFVKNLFVCLGKDASEVSESVELLCNNSLTYVAKSDIVDETMRKTIDLQWIHFNDENIPSVVNKNSDLNHIIRWYKYKLGAPTAEYAGVYWEPIEWPAGKYIGDNPINCKEFSYTFLPDINLQSEQVKAIVLYGTETTGYKVLRSNILYFRNQAEVINNATVAAMSALTVQCDDNTFGNYCIYNLGNSLIDSAQGTKVRKLIPYFKAQTAGVNEVASELLEAESVEWIFPLQNTMLVIDNEYLDGEVRYDTDANGNKTFVHIKRYGAANTGELGDKRFQKYRIKNYYSQSCNNNTIQCKITKERITYSTSKEMTFGAAGTAGTDCTLVLDFEDGKTAITLGNHDLPITVTARLYDNENKEVDLSSLTSEDIIWSWKTCNGNLGRPNLMTYNAVDGKPYQTILRPTTDTSVTKVGENYHILQVTIKNWGDYDLIAYLPIPVRSDINYSYISGTSQIIYDSSGGTSSYFQSPYKIYGSTGDEISLDWSCTNRTDKSGAYYIHNGKPQEDAYTPRIIKKDANYTLQPLSIYVKECCEYICVTAKNGSTVCWSQPLLIMQNKYPSAMLNSWDGKLSINEDKNSIMAAKIAAGRKESDNTFTGVIIGDWESQENDGSISKNTGVYGFSGGQQSFAFKDDGTAFLGKSGRGRIHFDGDKAEIYSSSWDADGNLANQAGMYLNLDSGILCMNKLGGYSRVELTKEQFENNISLYYINLDYQLSSSTQASDGVKYYLPNVFNLIALNTATYVPRKYYKKLTDTQTSTDTGLTDLGSGQSVGTTVSTSIDRVYNYGSSLVYRVVTVTTVIEQEKDKSTYSRKITTVTETYLLSIDTFDDKAEYYKVSKFTSATENELTKFTSNYFYSRINDFVSCQSAGYTTYDPNVTYYVNSNAAHYITISADEETYPVAIGDSESATGRGFRVSWDGSAFISDGKFTGEINAISGTLGNLTVTGTLSGGYIDGGIITGGSISGTSISASYLDAGLGYVGGWQISSQYLKGGSTTLNSQTGIETNTLLITGYGTMGMVQGDDGTGPTYNLGLKTTSSTSSIILSSAKNIKLSTPSGSLWVETRSPSDQHGIYARFA